MSSPVITPPPPRVVGETVLGCIPLLQVGWRQFGHKSRVIKEFEEARAARGGGTAGGRRARPSPPPPNGRQ